MAVITPNINNQTQNNHATSGVTFTDRPVGKSITSFQANSATISSVSRQSSSNINHYNNSTNTTQKPERAQSASVPVSNSYGSQSERAFNSNANQYVNSQAKHQIVNDNQVVNSNNDQRKYTISHSNQPQRNELATKNQQANNWQVNFASTTSNGTTTPTMTSDEHQADYHLTVQSGWGNDVQTIVKNPKGYYDIYFLQAPGGAQDHGTTTWEHTTTTDFKTFTPQNTAIGVGKGGNSWYGAATGSVIINQGNLAGVPKGAMVAYFTGYHNVQSIYVAYSDDNGKTFDHVLNNGNPILNYNSNGASQDPNNFRDACVNYWNGKLLMYVAEGNKFGVFSSTNGLNWNHVGDVNADQFANGMNFSKSDVPVECPVLRNMTDNQGKSHIVLFYGGKNDAAHQTTGMYYVVGHLDQNGLFVADNHAQRLDLGSDYYAANFDGGDDLGNANSSITSLGWIGNWGYTGSGVYANENNHTYPADKNQLSQRLGSYSLPRKLTLNSNGTINDTPLLGTTNNGNAIQCSIDQPSTSNNGNHKQTITETDGNQVYTLYDHENEPADSIYNLHFSTKNGQPYQGRIYIDIWQGADNVRFNFDPTNGWMQCGQYAKELDNDPTGMNASNTYQNGTLGNKKGYSANTNLSNVSSFNIKVFCDKDSVEFFFPNGQAYTVARYATQNNQDFKVYTQDAKDNNLLSVQKLSLANTTVSPNNSGSQSSSKPAGSLNANRPTNGSLSASVVKPTSQIDSTNKMSAQKPSVTASQSSSKGSVSVSQSAVKSSSVSQSSPITTSSANSSQSVIKKTSSSKSVVTGNQSQDKENTKPVSSASNLSNALSNAHQSNNKINTSTTVSANPIKSAGLSNTNKPNLSQSLQIGNGSTKIDQSNTGKGSLSASAVSGKASVVTDNNVSQASMTVKDSASINKSSVTNRTKTQSQERHANDSVSSSVAKSSASKDLTNKSAAVSQSSVALQSNKGNQSQSQGQHVNVKKNPAKIVKASSPVVQLAAKRNGCTSAGSSCQNKCKIPSAKTCGNAVTAGSIPVSKATEATTPVATSKVQQANVSSVQTQEPSAQGTQATASAVTSNVSSKSTTSSNAMPATGMHNQLADELGAIGVGLVLEVTAKRTKKDKNK